MGAIASHWLILHICVCCNTKTNTRHERAFNTGGVPLLQTQFMCVCLLLRRRAWHTLRPCNTHTHTFCAHERVHLYSARSVHTYDYLLVFSRSCLPMGE